MSMIHNSYNTRDMLSDVKDYIDDKMHSYALKEIEARIPHVAMLLRSNVAATQMRPKLVQMINRRIMKIFYLFFPYEESQDLKALADLSGVDTCREAYLGSVTLGTELVNIYLAITESNNIYFVAKYIDETGKTITLVNNEDSLAAAVYAANSALERRAKVDAMMKELMEGVEQNEQ